MRGKLVLLLVLLTMSAIGNSTDAPPKWVTFDRLCGSLEFFTPIPGGGNDSKPLKKVLLELYLWEEGVLCCNNSHPVFKTVTRSEGRYEFQNVDAGRYWLVAHWKGKTFRMPIVFTAKDSSNDDCELQGLDIDTSGNFGSWIRATM